MVSIREFFDDAVTWRNLGPYVWGGAVRRGNDCSGFICGVAAEVGAPFPYRMTAEGLRQFCHRVTPGDEQPGDLVFFENTDPSIWEREKPGPDGRLASHIGIVDTDWPIYMLDSHERSATSGVEYTNVQTSYWAPKLIEVRRVPQLIDARTVPPVDGPNWAEEISFVSNLLSEGGEIQSALRGILNGKMTKAQQQEAIQAILNRMNQLWKEYTNG